MPQEHHVLRCFSCETFQVHIVKKSNKWECKMCGIKQSVKRNYGKGSGKDCRNQVMKLNELRILKGNDSKLMCDGIELEKTFNDESMDQKLEEKKPCNSKWTEYLEENAVVDTGESEDDTINCLNEIFEKKKRRKRMPKNKQEKKICTNLKTDELPEGCDETQCFFQVVDAEIFETNVKKCFTEPKIEKNNHRKFPTEMKSELKNSKYTKYLDYDDDDDDDDDKDNSDVAQVNKGSDIFGLDSVDLDNILDF